MQQVGLAGWRDWFLGLGGCAGASGVEFKGWRGRVGLGGADFGVLQASFGVGRDRVWGAFWGFGASQVVFAFTNTQDGTSTRDARHDTAWHGKTRHEHTTRHDCAVDKSKTRIIDANHSIGKKSKL